MYSQVMYVLTTSIVKYGHLDVVGYNFRINERQVLDAISFPALFKS